MKMLGCNKKGITALDIIGNSNACIDKNSPCLTHFATQQKPLKVNF